MQRGQRDYEYILIDGSLKRRPVEKADKVNDFKDDQWRCHSCTLLNPANLTSCMVCENQRQIELNNLKSAVCKVPVDLFQACTLENAPGLIYCEACETPLDTVSRSNHDKPIQMNHPIPKFKTAKIAYATMELLRDILQPGSQILVLSSFQTNLEWLQQILPANIGQFIFVLHSKEAQQERMLDSQTRCVFPRLAGFGCMHTKLILSIYPSFTRVCITSANFVEYDWKLLENVAYCQDFPRNLQAEPCRFQSDLMRVCSDLSIPSSVIERLKEFDFTDARGHLIQSKPGNCRDGAYGLLSLKSAVRNLHLKHVSVSYMV